MARQIRAQIVSGVLQEGEQLPSIRVLAKELKISMLTAKRAYDELEAEGFVNSVQGKGNFVAPQNREFLREAYLKKMEALLQEASDLAAMAGVDDEALLRMLSNMLEGRYE
ncbi:GntR family transcriptional regulator [Aedoeadaptatus ivorii]|uniref:GntR family transcriptional regulator n=1 Tax=Aedoeadaptatus ivorii TaxID=54006 RepID=UPI0022B29448|nr:GntR family transcriptional regulator [Peptoniphilus ivorii]